MQQYSDSDNGGNFYFYGLTRQTVLHGIHQKRKGSRQRIIILWSGNHPQDIDTRFGR
jgi:hypothetical protein